MQGKARSRKGAARLRPSVGGLRRGEALLRMKLRKGEAGMTFLEILITVTILAVIAAVSAVSWFGYQRTTAVDAASREILSMLQEAQGNAIAAREDSRWGVRVMNTSGGGASWADIFYGNDYATGTKVRRATFSTYVELSNPSDNTAVDVVFEKRTGKPTTGGNVWTSYIDDTNANLKVARQVSSGGSGCTSATNPTLWTCVTVDATGNLAGEGTALAVDPYGNAWVAYQRVDGTGGNGDLKVAHYVGSLGNCDDSLGSDAWQCETVDTNNAGSWPAIAFDAAGNAWVAYQSNGTDLHVARYTGTGTETSCPGGNANWVCSLIQNVGTVGDYSSIVFDPSGDAWVSFVSVTGTEVRVAHYTGTGSETSCGNEGGENDWECWTLGSGSGTRIAVEPDGTVWVGYRADPNDFAVAQYVGTGGNCGSNAWSCTTVDEDSSISEQFGFTFDTQGLPWAAYDDETDVDLWVAYKDITF